MIAIWIGGFLFGLGVGLGLGLIIGSR